MKKFAYIYCFCLSTFLLGLSLASSAQSTDCLTFANLSQPAVSGNYGTADNPTAYSGLPGTHFVSLSNSSQMDEIIGDSLPKIPYGESAAVRIGPTGTPNSGSVLTYQLTVTENTQLLTLNSAMLFQVSDPMLLNNHYLKVEITDQNDILLNPTCGTSRFNAGQGSGWRTSYKAGTQYLWQNWTSNGFDLSAYLGQQIKFKIYLIKENATGYAYLTLHCTPRTIVQNNCGTDGSISMKAPAGFNYQWYEESHPGTLISTERTLNTPINDKKYICKCTSKVNPTCFFLLERQASVKLPFSNFDYFESCDTSRHNSNFVHFQNTSEVTINGYPSPTEKPDLFKWIFHDGTTSDLENPIKQYTIGTYPITLISGITGSACQDTLHYMVAVMDNSVANLISANICPGASYTMAGKTYSTQGVFIDTLKNRFGCDSILILRLRVNPNYSRNVSATICNGQTFTLNNKVYTAAGTYTDTLKTKMGCDSVFHLTLNTYPSYSIPVSAEICDGTSYSMNGKTYTTQGIHRDTLFTKNGCDSIFVLNLTVHPIVEHQLSLTICKGDSLLFLGKVYRTAGTYSDTITARTGCDSIFHFQLTISDPPLTTLAATICRGEIFYVGSIPHTTSGTYSDTLKTQYGCDSVVNLTLTVNPTASKNLSASMCQGEVYSMNGKSFYTTGIHRDTLKTVNGCDSIFILDLTVHPKYNLTPSATICHNTTYEYKGMVLRADTVITDSLHSRFGCDSIIVFTLKVNPEVRYDVTAYQDSVTGKGFLELRNTPVVWSHTINGVPNGSLSQLEPGSYTINVFDNIGCPGIPQTIEFSPCPELSLQIKDICLTPNEIKISTQLLKGEVLRYSIQFDSVAKAAGFTDIINATYTGDTILLPIPQGVDPQIFHAKISFISVYCHSVAMRLDIHIPYSSQILSQKWNDVIVIFNAQNNGGYTFTSYQWYKNGLPIPGETKPYLEQKPRLELNSAYSVLLTTTANDTALTCPLRPKLTDDYMIYPTLVDRTKGVFQFKMISPYDGSVRIWDAGGSLAKQQVIEKGTNLIHIESFAPGLYFVELKTITNETKTYRVIVK